MIRQEVLEKLEFYKVLQFISKYAATEPGKNRILEIKPFDTATEAITEGAYVSEAKEILIKNDIPPIAYIPELDMVLSRSRIEGAVLDSRNILDILNLAETSRRVFQFLKGQQEAPGLAKGFLNGLFVDKVFEHHVAIVIDENGDIRDSASNKLREIRADIKSKSDNLSRVINRILKNLSDSYLVRDEYITQRDGRMVVPIKAEHKRHVKGFIHSESATGQTVYIEPEETLELNNELLSLGFAEKREIERILRELTKKIGEVSYQLRQSLDTLAELDVIFSKARYSVEIIGAFPTINNYKPVRIYDARHPLLVKKLGRNNTVPLDLSIDGFNILLITGPNAGGKTVVLKTLGLISVMAQSGIHVPALPDSNLHFYDEILLDIGDQQSIEDDLSTFSSHLSNIKNILSIAGQTALVLIDELGTGTDPAEGSALSIAIMLKLNDAGATVVATTHHGSLKIIATQHEGFQNASMEFDIENLSPTYRLRQGIPGSSYAFEVAERIGFSRDFISLARGYLDANKMKVEDFLTELETKSRSLEAKLKTSEVENARLKGLTNLYSQNIEKLEQQKKEILKDAKLKAEEYLGDVNRKIEHAIKRIRESNADADSVKEARKLADELKSRNLKIAAEEKSGKTQAKQADLKAGGYAMLKGSELAGRIEEIDLSRGKAVLVAGHVKLQVNTSDLIPARKKDETGAGVRKQSYSGSSHGLRLDIRGRKPEEAEFEVIRFVDDAYSAGISRVEILHGKGTGVLKRMVKEILTKHDAVSKFYFADIESGGDGITIAEMKE